MRKIALLLTIISPFFLAAQNETIDLSSYGIKATINNPTNAEYTVTKSNDDGTKEYNVKVNGQYIKVTDYAKPMTAKKVMDIYRTMPKTKSKSTKFKLIEQGPTKVVLERTLNEEIDYLLFYAFTQKGKQIVVQVSDLKNLESCKQYQKMVESFKLL